MLFQSVSHALGGSSNVPRVNGSAAGGVLSLLLRAGVVLSEQRPPSCEEGLRRCQTFVCPASSPQTNADEGIFLERLQLRVAVGSINAIGPPNEGTAGPCAPAAQR